MDLIEILWRQDIDLGVERDAYDATKRLELEKQKEDELAQHREKEKRLEEVRQKTEQENNNNMTYVVDEETGEVITVPISSVRPIEESIVSFTHTQQGSDLQVEPQQSADQLDPSQDLDLPEVGDEGFSMEEAMDILQQGVNNFTLSGHVAAPSDNITAQLSELENMISDVAHMYENSTTQIQQPIPPLQHQNSMEQRWQDITSLIPLEAANNQSQSLGELTTLFSDFEPNVALIPENSLIQNTSMVPQHTMANNSFDEGFSYTDLTNATIPANLNTNYTMMPSESLGLQNSSLAPGGGFVNSTETLMQQLLHREDMMGLDASNISPDTRTMEINDTSDSALSSLGQSSISSTFMNMSDHSEGSYEMLEGATGGSDVDDHTYTNMETKHKYEPDSTYTDQGYVEGWSIYVNQSEGSNTSDTSNCTDQTYNADPRQVLHNHTYTVQPGQQLKERKTKRIKDEVEQHDLQYTRDEKRAKSMNIPLTMDDMIHSSVEEFNEMLQGNRLSEVQLQLIRDIRRRGKNKVAAQNCRKRKLEVIQALEEEVDKMRQNRDRLRAQRKSLDKEMGGFKNKYNSLYEKVFSTLRDDQGHPYDPDEYALQQNDQGEMFLVPHNATSCIKEDNKKGNRKRKHDRKGR